MPIALVERREGLFHRRVALRPRRNILRAASSSVRLAVSLCASALFLALPGHASAQLVDPGHILGNTLEKAGKVVEGSTETVEEVFSEAKKKVDETAIQVHDSIDRVIDGVGGLPQLPDEPQPEPEQPTGNEEPTQPRHDPGPQNPEGDGASRSADRVLSASATRAGERDRRVRTFAPSGAGAGVGTTPVVEVARGSSLPDRSPATPAEAAGRLAFPLFMIAAVVAFLLLQGRFDRRDPKLSFETDVDSDSLSFE